MWVDANTRTPEPYCPHCEVTDTANKPADTTQVGGSHYKDKAIQPIEYIHANGIGFCEGNVIKYVTRWKGKNGVADLEKARHYLDILIQLEQRKITS